jgi:hypothetical protein
MPLLNLFEIYNVKVDNDSNTTTDDSNQTIDTNMFIVNKLNEFIEEIPKYKDLYDKYKDISVNYNKLLENEIIIKRQNEICEKYIKILLVKNMNLNKLNKHLIKRMPTNNMGYWYEDYSNSQNDIEVDIIEKNNNLIKNINDDDIYNLYSLYGMQVCDDTNNILDNSVSEEEEEEEEEESSKEDDDNEEEQSEVFEMIINKIRYYVTDQKNGDIYKIIENDEVGDKIGKLKDGKPIFIFT